MKCTHTRARARNRCKEYAYMAVAVIYVAFKVWWRGLGVVALTKQPQPYR